MQYSMLGNTGLLVSRLCFGAMTFHEASTVMATVAKVRGKDADTLVGRSLDAGVNFFDTADIYSAGESETMLGAALKSRRNEVVIATKCGMRSGPGLTQSGLTRRHILWSVEQSLRRLGTDWIDVYIAHRQDPLTPLAETLQAFDDIVRAGKVRYLGFSNWNAWKASAAMEMQKANGWASFTHGQMSYSLLTRDVEHEVLPMMREYGLGLTAWSPLASGLLSGKYTRDGAVDPASRLSGTTPSSAAVDRGRAFALLDMLRPMAERRRVSVAQLSLAWLLANPGVSSVILGATKLTQLEDNLGASNLTLSPEELRELDTANPLPRLYPNSFHQWVADKTALVALGRGRDAG
jgi:aryl-alcohol dehydrogenase-like predicted oxidoreductase